MIIVIISLKQVMGTMVLNPHMFGCKFLAGLWADLLRSSQTKVQPGKNLNPPQVYEKHNYTKVYVNRPPILISMLC